MTQGQLEAAEASLRSLRNKNIDETEFQAELNEIRISTQEQHEQHKGKHLWVEMWKGTELRRTLLSIAIICFHAANGIQCAHPLVLIVTNYLANELTT